MPVNVNRRRFIEAGAGAATALLLGDRVWGQNNRPPNIVLIVADDLGIETLQPYGSQFYRTPRLNQLARESLLFNHCYATPLCTPSRLMLMTGKYNHRNYVTFSNLPRGERTIAHLLREKGYKTCIVGKWQLARIQGQRPDEAGFDEFSLSPGPDAKSGTPTGSLIYWFPKINENDVWKPTTPDQYGPDLSVQYLLNFISQNQNRPFFAYYAMHLPHGPHDATPDSADPSIRSDIVVFPDMVTYLDKQVGQILQKLDRLNLRQNTVVIFTSDNGSPPEVTSPFQGGQVRGGKSLMNDRGTHVPLIVNWPGVISPNSRTNAIVDFTDFFPTFSEMAGGNQSEAQSLDGVSMLPIWRGEVQNTKGYAMIAYPERYASDLRSFWARTQQYKLYDSGLMYDIPADPEEQAPIYPQDDNSQQQIIRRRLEVTLRRFGLSVPRPRKPG
ncbi:sulfatase-like hydrolase/transferase [Lyngbya confervoides]|uniref:Sulfatase-like hydrolase/transferase n=1 Tax=Lyngbya confervoides BDU141951 TaxID=1574623 RepID=A0ABD4T4P8_9CYAN|nr:sulfatase-like hydrolase/transferase [Lyngbya confervoides]MCM1983497.1 sulfatase-like hydrolase/transferase [Lyngbya confervoides BDU141951]